MNKIVEENVLFSLYSASCLQNGLCRITLSITDTQNKHAQYVDFFFSSIDYMILHLRILAKNSGSYSINNLRLCTYEAKMKYEQGYNVPDSFLTLYLSNGHKWPSKQVHAMFKNDFSV